MIPGSESPACPYAPEFAWTNGVYPEGEIRRLSHHAAYCLPCMEEFVRLLMDAVAATPSRTIGAEYG